MDWIQFAEDNSIEYVTRGPNTKRGEISVQCPWCGEDDPSQHLGISLSSENWGCHRSAEHRGHNPVRLVAALLNCSYPQAKLVVAQYSIADPDSLEGVLAALTGASAPLKAIAGPVKLPADFRRIKRNGVTKRFWHYLKGRKFDDVDGLVERYELMCCTTGDWKDRVLIPFYQNGELVGWTGRALTDPINAPRYKSSSETVKTTVFCEDELYEGGKLLTVVEGPFDAMKFDFYGEPLGVRTTCVFGVTMSIDQICILNSLRRRWQHIAVIFDPDALEPSLNAKDWIIGPNVSVEAFTGDEDPGAMSPKQTVDYLSKLRNRYA